MTYPVIPELPDPPVRSDGRVDFARKGSAFLGAFPAMRSAFNAAGAWIEAAMTTILGYKGDAEQAVSDAQGYAGNAANSANQSLGFAENAGTYALESEGYAQQANAFSQLAASVANFVGPWTELSGSLLTPASTRHNGTYWTLLRNISDVAASEPGVSADWAPVDVDDVQSWITITGSTTLETGNRYAVNFAAGTVLTLPASPPTNGTIDLYRRSGDPRGAVINRNGKTIMGLAENLTLDTSVTGLSLIYTGTDWRLK